MVDWVFSTEVRDYGIDDALCAYVIDQIGAEADPEVMMLVNCVVGHPDRHIHDDGRSVAYQFWAVSSSWSPRSSPARRVRRPACTDGWRDEFDSRPSAWANQNMEPWLKRDWAEGQAEGYLSGSQCPDEHRNEALEEVFRRSLSRPVRPGGTGCGRRRE